VKRLALLAILAATRAHAAPAEFAEGEKLYKAGRYLDAAEKFRVAYEAEADPNFLLDAAQAYRFGEDCAHSAESYRAYLEKMPAAPEAEKIRGYIAEQEACAKRKAAEKPAPVAAPVAVHAPEAPGHARLYIGIASAIAGGVAIGLGFYEDSKLDGIATRRSASVAHCTQTNICTASEYNATVKPYDDLAAAKQRNGIIGYSVGGLAVAAAVYLIIADLTPEHGALRIAPTPTGAMAFGTWRF
jgi:hypothetical protein